MFGAVIEVQKQLEIQSQQKAKDEMSEIPSIGWLSDYMAINVWAAKYFKPVANALWDGKPKDHVLALWAKTKRTTDSTPKVSLTERAEHAKINKSHKKLRALAELHKNKSDRWEKTSWSVVK